MVAEIQERWPALLIKEQVRKCVEKVAHYLIPQNYFFHAPQICSKFYHVTINNMLGTFRAALDTHCPHLLKLYRARKGAFGQDMESLLDVLDEPVNSCNTHHLYLIMVQDYLCQSL